MVITATELKNNMGKYLELSQKEEILITKNGKVFAKLCSPYADKLGIVRELSGSLRFEGDPMKALQGRIEDYESSH